MTDLESEAGGITLMTNLQEALSGVSDWRSQAEATIASRLERIDLEEQRLREAVAQLGAELTSLESLRAQIHAETAELDGAQNDRAHHAMLEGLGRERDLLASRSVELATAREAAQASLQDELQTPEMAELLSEFERFSEVEPTLAALPESYRKAILDQHEKNRSRLQPYFEKLQAAGPALDTSEVALSVVASLEMDDDGDVESLTFVLPVDAAVYSRWSEQEEDLPTRLGYRAVAMAAKLAHALDSASAPLTCREHEGFLAVHLWLGDGEVSGDIQAAAVAAAAETFDGADQLNAAQISVTLEWLAPEVLDPPEDDEAAVKVRLANPVAEA